jgi:hypothetical protein
VSNAVNLPARDAVVNRARNDEELPHQERDTLKFVDHHFFVAERRDDRVPILAQLAVATARQMSFGRLASPLADSIALGC